MSLKPGIGASWLKKYKTDVYPGDFTILNGRKIRPPKFYDRELEKIHKEEAEKVKDNRKYSVRALERTGKLDIDPERLRVKEEISKLKIKKLIREIT